MYQKNWIPYEIEYVAGEFKAKWLCLGEQLFLEPFFEDTLSICKRLPENRKPNKEEISLNYLDEVIQEIETLHPSAFIFHVSRCGSSLLAQQLSTCEENIVISEAPILDTILRWKYAAPEIPETTRNDYFKKIIEIIGQKRFASQKDFFIKWDSWHLFFLDEIRKCYPETPFVFLTRELSEVRLSHQKIPGMHAIRGVIEPAIFGFCNDDDLMEIEPLQYLDEVISKMLVKSHEFSSKDKNTILLKYEDGVLNNYLKFLQFLNLNYSLNAILKATNRLLYHSKNPNEIFEPTT